MDHYTVVTPSNIEVEYRLANAGSRLASFIIDTTLQIIAILSITFVVLFGIQGLRFNDLDEMGGMSFAFVLIAAFVIHFGYYIVCEMLMNGQTFGKRIFRLRVIRDNGLPVELSQSLIRNLLRTGVDMLYVGLFLILFTKYHKRLGDMAAGTIVVSEHPHPPLPQFKPLPVDLSDILPDRPLTQEEQSIINQWAARRFDLPDQGDAIRESLKIYFQNTP